MLAMYKETQRKLLSLDIEGVRTTFDRRGQIRFPFFFSLLLLNGGDGPTDGPPYGPPFLFLSSNPRTSANAHYQIVGATGEELMLRRVNSALLKSPCVSKRRVL